MNLLYIVKNSSVFHGFDLIWPKTKADLQSKYKMYFNLFRSNFNTSNSCFFQII